MPCSPLSPCSGKYIVDPVVARDTANLSGAVRLICPSRTCTRDAWVHPVATVVRPESRTHPERIMDALNEQPHWCEDCRQPMRIRMNRQKRCEACRPAAKLRVTQARRRGRGKKSGAALVAEVPAA